MENLLVGIVIASAVGVVALLARSRRVADAPTQRTFSVPSQVDRADFGSPTEEWLIAVFTSASCPVCADVSAKVQALASRHVATRVVDFSTQRDLHTRYRIDAVPLIVIADSAGVVVHHVLGPVSATDLWATVAAVRDGSIPLSGECPNH
jgi:thioredoxin-related protein